jgi:hypothetical protein
MPKRERNTPARYDATVLFLVLVASISHIHQNPYTTPLDKKATD